MSNSSGNSRRSSSSKSQKSVKEKSDQENKGDSIELKNQSMEKENLKKETREEKENSQLRNSFEETKAKEVPNQLLNEEIIHLREEKEKEIAKRNLFQNIENVSFAQQKLIEYLQKLHIPKSQKEAALKINQLLKGKVSNQIKNNQIVHIKSREYLLDSSHKLKMEKLSRKSTDLNNSIEKSSNFREKNQNEIKLKIEEEKQKYACEFSKKVAKQQKELNLNKKKREQENDAKRKEEEKLAYEYKSMAEEDIQGHKRNILEKRINEAKTRRQKEKDNFKELKEKNSTKKYNYYHERNDIKEGSPVEKKREKYLNAEKNHQNNFQSYKSLKPLKNQNFNLVQRMIEQNSYEKSANSKLISLTLERVLEEDRKKKDDQRQKEEEMRLLKHKMRAYGEIIKQTYLPIPSEKKANELQSKINKLKHPVMQTKEVKQNYVAHEILPKLNKHRNIINKLSDNENSIDGITLNKSNSKTSNINKHKQSKDSDSVNNPNEKIKKINYLDELKQKRSKVPTRMQLLDWKSDLNNEKLSIVEKFNRVSQKASQLQADAEMKEKLLRNNGMTKKNLNIEEEAADMYVDAIKAKLAIFEKFE